MNRLLVYTREFTLNIVADEMHEENGKLKAYNNRKLVGIFDVEVVQSAYISPKGGNGNE